MLTLCTLYDEVKRPRFFQRQQYTRRRSKAGRSDRNAATAPQIITPAAELARHAKKFGKRDFLRTRAP